MCRNGSGGDSLADGALNFLLARQQAICVAPLGPEFASGYVWRRVFLRGRPPGMRPGFWD